jgi:hypothetical protein
MTLSDGAILLFACIGSFLIGFGVGVFRVSRFVSKELKHVSIEVEQQKHALQQFFSKLGEEDKQNER